MLVIEDFLVLIHDSHKQMVGVLAEDRENFDNNLRHRVLSLALSQVDSISLLSRDFRSKHEDVSLAPFLKIMEAG